MTILTIDRQSDISQPHIEQHSNEQLKAKSHFLRGTIREGLNDSNTGSISHDDGLLTKFHGIYQQDDRDTRQHRLIRKLEPHYQFMVRLRIPGGRLTKQQWIEIDRLSRIYSSNGIRITTRQTIQLHGVKKQCLQPLLISLEKIKIDTIAACGDDNRGIVCGVNPDESKISQQVYKIAKETSMRLLPKTAAYRETWYDSPPSVSHSEEPLYGDTYLPRKFKIGFVIPPDNDIDIFAQDVGFIAVIKESRLVGFNVCVGGGMGQLDSREDSYPRLSTPIGFIDASDAPFIAEVIMSIQRDYGDRKDRHRARFKYTLDRIGLDNFKELLISRFGKKLAPLKPYKFAHNGDKLGWHQTEDSQWCATLHIQSGRINDHLQDQLQAFFQQYSGEVRLTANQNIQLINIPPYDIYDVARRLSDLGLYERLLPSNQEAATLSCVALPTCGLAMAEAERITPEFLTLFDDLKRQYNLQKTPITLRITGCPNGCARPYLAEIALTGRAPGLYNLYLGGSHRGDRLATLHEKNLSQTQVLDAIAPLFDLYSTDRIDKEHFGDFLHRCNFIKSSSISNQSIQER